MEVMTTEDWIDVYSALDERGIYVRIGGGWGAIRIRVVRLRPSVRDSYLEPRLLRVVLVGWTAKSSRCSSFHGQPARSHRFCKSLAIRAYCRSYKREFLAAGAPFESFSSNHHTKLGTCRILGTRQRWITGDEYSLRRDCAGAEEGT